MDQKKVKAIIEAALFSRQEPASLNELHKMFSKEDEVSRGQIKEAFADLQAEAEGRGIQWVEVASGYRVQISEEATPWVAKLTELRPPRFSRAMMETLALIAYRQPLTRAEIEHVRGVAVSSNIVRNLLEREWVRVVGHRDVPGKPALLGTTRNFLDYFGLKSLDELPKLLELTDIESIKLPGELFDEDGEVAEGAATDGADRGDEETTDNVTPTEAGEEALEAVDSEDAEGAELEDDDDSAMFSSSDDDEPSSEEELEALASA